MQLHLISPQNGLNFMEDNCKMTVLFVVKCVRSLTPKDSGEL